MKSRLIFCFFSCLLIFSCSTTPPTEKHIEVIIPFTSEYNVAEKFIDGLSVVYKGKGEKYGFVNKKGEMFIPFIYDYVGNFEDGLAVVKENDKYGCIDPTGKIIIPIDYSLTDAINKKWSLKQKQKESKSEYIDTLGNSVSFSSNDYKKNAMGSIRLRKGKKYGLIDTTGKVILPATYDLFTIFLDSLAFVCKDGKCGHIDGTGKVVIPLTEKGKRYGLFSEGLTSFGQDEKYGFIDKTGKVVILAVYDYVQGFSNGLARVQKDKKYGYINKKGEIVLPIVYDYGESFTNGLAKVYKDKKVGFINTKGEEIVSISYNNSKDISEGVVWLKYGKKWGLFDISASLVE